MTNLIKNFFSFSDSRTKDNQINNGILKVQLLVKQLQKQKYVDLPNKVKQILNILLKNPQGKSLYELSYESSMTQKAIEWIPNHCKLIKILNPKQTFMKNILDLQDLKIPIQKQYIPNFLFKNNILNQRSGYRQIIYSIQGLIVPLLDYVFIRLIHAIFQLNFIQKPKTLKQEYQSDDLYSYVSRNPYLMLLNQYFDEFKNEKNQKKLVNYVKLYFVDDILDKYRVNKPLTIRNSYSFSSTNYKIKPHYLLAMFLLLKYVKFEQKNLWLTEIVNRYPYLIERDTQIFFRFFIRLFILSYTKNSVENSVENSVIQTLKKANQNDGVFQIQRYQTKQFKLGLRGGMEKRQKSQFDKLKTSFLKLLERDKNFMINKRVHFSTVRSIAAYLTYQMQSKNISTQKSQIHQINSQASNVQRMILKTLPYYKTQIQKNKQDIIQNEQQELDQNTIDRLENQLKKLVQLYQQTYNRSFNMKYQYIQNGPDNLNTNYNIRGLTSDYTASVETYRNQIQYSCWKIPLKDSEFQILYDFFYYIAKSSDKIIPGHKNRKQPILNLRFLCNPTLFAITLVILILLYKIIF